jgi:solute carrier family 10 (sodium/bile acid cotransporter), member 7
LKAKKTNTKTAACAQSRNNEMINWFQKQWFFVGIAIVVALAVLFPDLGVVIKKYKILNMGIFIAFLITGLSLDTRSVIEQLHNLRVLIAALASSLILIPVLTFFLANLAFSGSPDLVIGSVIIAVAPVTVASGTVMTAVALGNVPLSLFICVLSNFVALLTIPFLLKILLQFGHTIDLPVYSILASLALTVLAPTILGQVLRPRLKEVIFPYKKAFSVFSQGVVLLIIFNAVSASISEILHSGLIIVLVFGFMIILRTLILVMNFTISRIIGLDQASTSAFTIHTSQKTLTVSYLVWAGYFAADFPMAMIPPIAFHLTQMFMDTMLAHYFRKKALEKPL